MFAARKASGSNFTHLCKLSRTPLFVGLMLAAALPVFAEGPASTDTTDVAEPPVMAVETFESVWRQVNDSAYDVGRSGLDWDAVREEFLPRVQEVESAGQLRLVLQEMLDRIGESHFAIIPASLMSLGPDSGQGASRFDTGLQARLLDGSIWITRVESGSAADKAGIAPGWQLREVNEINLVEALDTLSSVSSDVAQRQSETMIESALQNRLSERRSADVLAMKLINNDGVELSIELTPEPARGEMATIPMLPPTLVQTDVRQMADGDSCIGLIRFNIWVPLAAEHVQAAMPELKECAGMIMDLRGNPGGVMALMMPIAGHLLDKSTTLGTLKTPDSTLNFHAFPRRVNSEGELLQPYAGPVAIIIDGLSMSTSEMFSSGMQAIGRARIFGTPSPGMALPAQVTRLPNGDSLMYAFAEYTNPAGQRIEGLGVVPDQIQAMDPASLKSGEDAAMSAAMDWIRSSSNSTTPQ